MKILIVYATTEGQTRKIARFAADHLTEAGHSVEMLPAADAADLNIGTFDGAIIAGSIHAGRYQKKLRAFVKQHSAALAELPTMFWSVSLAAAGEDDEDWKGIRACVDRFTEKTGWTPGRVEHVAGAFRFDEYDFFKSWAMRWIAREKGETAPAHGENAEHTDWAALKRILEDWVSTLA